MEQDQLRRMQASEIFDSRTSCSRPRGGQKAGAPGRHGSPGELLLCFIRAARGGPVSHPSILQVSHDSR